MTTPGDAELVRSEASSASSCGCVLKARSGSSIATAAAASSGAILGEFRVVGKHLHGLVPFIDVCSLHHEDRCWSALGRWGPLLSSSGSRRRLATAAAVEQGLGKELHGWLFGWCCSCFLNLVVKLVFVSLRFVRRKETCRGKERHQSEADERQHGEYYMGRPTSQQAI